MLAAFWGNGFAVCEAGNPISRNSSLLSTTFFLEDRALNSKIFLEDLTLTSSFLKSREKP